MSYENQIQEYDDHNEYVENIEEHLDDILEEEWESVRPDYLIHLRDSDGPDILAFFSPEQLKPKYRKVLDAIVESDYLDLSLIQTKEEQLQDHIVRVLDVVFTVTGGTPLEVKHSCVLDFCR